MTQSLSETEESDQTPTRSSGESVVEWVVLGVDQTRLVRVLNREATRIGPGLGAITRWAEPPGKDQCLVREFGSEFFRTVDLGQQYDTVSHVGGIVFHSIQQSTFGVSHSA